MTKANIFSFLGRRKRYAPLQTPHSSDSMSSIHIDASEKFLDSPQSPVAEMEDQNLLESDECSTNRRTSAAKIHILVLYVVNITLTAVVIILTLKLRLSARADPSLGIWSPANGAVEYVEHHFDAAFFSKTEYMGFPTDEIDKRWVDLYDFGNTIITEKEAKNLHTPTLPIPGTKDYLIQLDVWHELHCLNDLRKVFYPERFPSLANITVDGKIDRTATEFRHWEHCIDALRQTLMCHADVAPIPFHINVPVSSGVFARLATTHTCRNFTKIQEWAKSHSAGNFRYKLEPEEAQEIIDTAGFDQSPEEDIESFWPGFPGNLFFKHWRELAGILDD